MGKIRNQNIGGEISVDDDDDDFSNCRESTARGMFSWSGLHLDSWGGCTLYMMARRTADTVGMYAVLFLARSHVSPMSWQSLLNILLALSPPSSVPLPFSCNGNHHEAISDLFLCYYQTHEKRKLAKLRRFRGGCKLVVVEWTGNDAPDGESIPRLQSPPERLWFVSQNGKWDLRLRYDFILIHLIHLDRFKVVFLWNKWYDFVLELI